MTLYRKHRGSLVQSMATTREVADFGTLVALLNEQLFNYDRIVTAAMVKIEPYRFDGRTSWDTHIVTIDGYGVTGYTNGPLAHEDKSDA